MIQVVNGYVCMDCADVALAKKDVNPAHPPADPNNPPSSSATSASGGPSNTQSAPAVTFGGSLADLNSVADAPQPSSATGQSQAIPGQPAQSQPGQSLYNPSPGSRVSLTA
jgi:hypothetical protein